MKKSFQQVSSKIYDTYGENSILPIMFGVSSLFKNEIVTNYGQFPHLFLSGEFGTGKTSLIHFIKQMLGQSVDIVYNFKNNNDLYEKLSRNEVAFFDEYSTTPNLKNESLIKAIYDDMSFFIGTSTLDKPTKNKFKASLAIAVKEVPQSPTLLHRCVLQSLDKQFFLNDECLKFDELKLFFQNHDCNSYEELQEYKDIVKSNFESNLPEGVTDNYFDLTARITGNYKVLVSVYRSLLPHLDFPFLGSDLRRAIVRNHCKHTLLVI